MRARAPNAIRIAAAVACIVFLLASGVTGGADAPRWADPAKTIRIMFPIAETGFDPQATQDYYSSHVERAIFDTLYVFDYLQRPYKFVPNVAAAMPEISADGRTWTIRIKPGIYFADDPAFKGKPRELTAADFVYAWKRLLDPRIRAPFLWYLDGKVAGAEAALAKAKETGRLDYDIADGRAEGGRSLHAAARAEGARLRDAGLHDPAADGRGRARGDRSVRRRVAAGRWPTRSAPAPTASRSGAAARRSCSRRIRAIARSTFPRTASRATAS